MAHPKDRKRVRFAAGSSAQGIDPAEMSRALFTEPGGEELDSDIDDGLEADLTTGRQRRKINIDGYGSDASEQDEVGNLSDFSDAEDERNPNGIEDEAQPDKEDGDDMFAEEAAAEGDRKRKRYLDIGDIEGQEMSSVSRTEAPEASLADPKGKRVEAEAAQEPGSSRIEAFNMKDDMDEGSFDAMGNFVWNKKDPQSYQDHWLADVSNSAISKARDSKAKEDQRQTTRSQHIALRWDAISNDDIILEIINTLQPGETVFSALARIGGPKKKTKNKWSKRARMKKAEEDKDDYKECQRKHDIERLTELADQAMARGLSSVYEDTYEQLVRQMRLADRVPDDWTPGTLLPTTCLPGPDDGSGLLDDLL
ncbi:hypothetical protein GGF46_004553 [Coemansia sp. RSA 552]|nr:hypothetical protein GGF46_004553 [Coemansia sp. RSA 552]